MPTYWFLIIIWVLSLILNCIYFFFFDSIIYSLTILDYISWFLSPILAILIFPWLIYLLNYFIIKYYSKFKREKTILENILIIIWFIIPYIFIAIVFYILRNYYAT